MTQRHFPHHRAQKAASRPYRFVRLDARRLPTGEFTLICSSDADALAVGRHLGTGVEVWDGARPVSVDKTAPPNAIAHPLAPEPPANHAELDPGPPRVFNPFRREAWRRR
jgi:hypothetical protein